MFTPCVADPDRTTTMQDAHLLCSAPKYSPAAAILGEPGAWLLLLLSPIPRPCFDMLLVLPPLPLLRPAADLGMPLLPLS
jgi:hypothetical protein